MAQVHPPHTKGEAEDSPLLHSQVLALVNHLPHHHPRNVPLSSPLSIIVSSLDHKARSLGHMLVIIAFHCNPEKADKENNVC